MLEAGKCRNVFDDFPLSKMSDTVLVYIIDDDDSVRRGLSRLMRASGYRVSVFDAAEQFLEDVSEASSGCVLQDITMPGMTGLQVQAGCGKKASVCPQSQFSAEDNDDVRRPPASQVPNSFYANPWTIRPCSMRFSG